MVLCWYCMKRPARHLVELAHPPTGLIQMSLSTRPGDNYNVDILLFCSMRCAASMGIRAVHEQDGGSYWCPECAEWRVKDRDIEDGPCPHFPEILERIVPGGGPPCFLCEQRAARPIRTREPAAESERIFCGSKCAARYGIGSEGGSWYWSDERRMWLDRDAVPAPQGTPGRVITMRFSPEEAEEIRTRLDEPSEQE